MTRYDHDQHLLEHILIIYSSRKMMMGLKSAHLTMFWTKKKHSVT